jgi:2-C-methyl-D-erythritol 4-phosphate cytidylyltransferase/2-C-methyl-D-erythritol 2,4-cyclodiphosphate synthase
MTTSDAGSGSSREAVAILVAAGRGLRAGGGVPKQFRLLAGAPLLAWTVRPFLARPGIGRVILVVPEPARASRLLAGHLPPDREVEFVAGGETRQDSTAAGLARAGSADLVLVHDGVRPLCSADLVGRVLSAAARYGAAVPLVPLHETLKRVEPDGRVAQTADRSRFALSQTPQGFRRGILEDALRRARIEEYVGTDESELVERAGYPVTRVEGETGNLKVTRPEDFALAERLMGFRPTASPPARVGIGFDVHPLMPGRPLVLGGVKIPHPTGPAGHSDGDLICHAATDALLGAAGLPDIGQLFPDDDPAHRGARSLDLLARAMTRVREAGFQLGNLDVVVIAEEPKLSGHLAAMRENLAGALAATPEQISIKGKRGEGVGPEGRREAMSAHAVALLVGRAEA